MARVNYAVNPSIENDTLYWGWGALSDPRTYNTTEHLFGVGSMLFTASQIDDRTYLQINDSGVTPETGRRYTFSAYLKGSGTLKIWCYDGAADNYSADIVLTSTWTRYSITVTCSGTTMYAGFRLTSANSVTCYIDGVLWEASGDLGDYFDGTYSNAQWFGTAHQSRSIENSKAFKLNNLRPMAFAPGLAR